MKKLLCVIGQLGEGGSEKQLHLFLKHLDRSEYDPSVVVASGRIIDKWRDAFGELNVPLDSLSGPPPVKALRFKSKLRNSKPDIIFSWSFYTNVLKLVSGKIPFIGSLRGGLGEEKLGMPKWLLSKALSPAPMVVNSLGLERELLDDGVPKDNIVVIPNIFERRFKEANTAEIKSEARARLLERLGIPQDAIIISGGGRLSPSKDFPFWLASFRELAKIAPTVHGVLFGYGPQVLADELEGAPLGEKVHLIGRLPDVSDILLASDVFFLSSIHEGLPNILLEAIDAGCAIVTTEVNGAEEILGDDEQLLSLSLLKERSPAKAAKMLKNLSTDDTAKSTASTLAQRRLEIFSPEKIAPIYAELLTQSLR